MSRPVLVDGCAEDVSASITEDKILTNLALMLLRYPPEGSSTNLSILYTAYMKPSKLTNYTWYLRQVTSRNQGGGGPLIPDIGLEGGGVQLALIYFVTW